MMFQQKEISCKLEAPFNDAWRMPLEPENGHVRLRVLSDRTTLEIFAQDGASGMAVPNLTTEWSKPRLGLSSIGGDITITLMDIYSMHSIWE